MIKRLSLVTSNSFNPYENLSLEEYMLYNLSDNEMIVFLWQNEHTVVIGHNQNAYNEVNLKSLYDDKGLLARRITGGGAVYHDLGNLNFSFILNKKDYDVNNQLGIIAEALKSFDINAEFTGRNDISVNGRKFSGNAFYDNQINCLHHGTILVDAKINALSKYLNVKEDKLKGKGVNSVAARVINLTELNADITIDKVKNAIFETVKNKYKGVEVKITDNGYINNNEIIELKNRYSNNDFILGKEVTLATNYVKRFDWGGVDIRLNLNKGEITELKIYSDSLDVDSIINAEKKLVGMSILKPIKTDNKIINNIIDLIIG